MNFKSIGFKIIEVYSEVKNEKNLGLLGKEKESYLLKTMIVCAVFQEYI
jgi:hypothetical protein